MADEKKEKKAGDPVIKDMWTTLEEILVVLIVVYLVYRAIVAISHGFDYYVVHNLDQDSAFRRFYADPSLRNLRRMSQTSPLISTIYLTLIFLKYFAYVLSAFFIGLIVWFFRKLVKMSDEEHIELNTPRGVHVEEDPGKKRWNKIVKYVDSENPADWRLAILEADIILDEILDVNGYRGETIGDKLKKVEPSDMTSLNDAWEAHKIRNAIAHQGESFILTPREAKRVIGLYENVLREYEYM